MAAIFAALAIAAGIGDWRRRRRIDLDSVGWVDWPTVQVIALIGLAIAGSIAFHH